MARSSDSTVSGRTISEAFFFAVMGGGWAFLALDPGGHIGRHPVVLSQLFVILEGSGWVAGDDGVRISIRAGQAALWDQGESHESGSQDGMRVAVLEAEAIDLPE